MARTLMVAAVLLAGCADDSHCPAPPYGECWVGACHVPCVDMKHPSDANPAGCPPDPTQSVYCPSANTVCAYPNVTLVCKGDYLNDSRCPEPLPSGVCTSDEYSLDCRYYLEVDCECWSVCSVQEWRCTMGVPFDLSVPGDFAGVDLCPG